jgi:hypothetical protein
MTEETPMKLIVDLQTGVERYVAMTSEEIQQRELDAIEAATRKAEEDANAQALAELKASAKAKLIAGQPLTEEEAATIVL